MSKTHYFAIAVAAGLTLAGCNAGMEPEGPTPDQIRAKLATLPPNEQIAMLQHSPMPKAEQEQKIEEIRTKYGLPAPASSTASPSLKSNPNGR
jgi:hypothetical protein